MDDAKNRKSAAIGCVLVANLFCAVPLGAIASAPQRVTNQEYRFSVGFSVGNVVCTATSGDHPHGFFVRFETSETDCSNLKDDPAVSAISINAYGNTTFERTPEGVLVGLCGNDGAREGQIRSGVLKGLAFNGRRSATCLVKGTDGSIDIYVVTQAGKWPGTHESADLSAPYINYTASLHTTRSRIDRDIKTFRRVLSSVCIGYPK